MNDLVSNLVYCGKAADVETVMVGGRIVVENRRIAGVDPGDLYTRATEAVRRIRSGK